MSRLPIVSGDLNAWGAILNDYLSQEHTATGGHGAVTATSLAITVTAGNITFPDPQLNSNTILWNGPFAPQIVGNSAGAGLTMACTGSEFIFSILRRDIVAGAQSAGNMNFEMPNSNGLAYRIGFIHGKQTDNTAGSEDGYINVETIEAGVNTERVRFGDASWACTGLGSNQFLAQNTLTHQVALFHNGATGFLATLQGDPLDLRTNNTSRILIGGAGGITLSGFGGGTGVMSVGAVDSGGAGFRLLRVPN